MTLFAAGLPAVPWGRAWREAAGRSGEGSHPPQKDRQVPGRRVGLTRIQPLPPGDGGVGGGTVRLAPLLSQCPRAPPWVAGYRKLPLSRARWPSCHVGGLSLRGQALPLVPCQLLQTTPASVLSLPPAPTEVGQAPVK